MLDLVKTRTPCHNIEIWVPGLLCREPKCCLISFVNRLNIALVACFTCLSCNSAGPDFCVPCESHVVQQTRNSEVSLWFDRATEATSRFLCAVQEPCRTADSDLGNVFVVRPAIEATSAGHRPAVAWPSLGHRLAVAWPSLGRRLAVAGRRLAVAWRSLGRRLAVAWPSLGRRRPSLGRRLAVA